MCQVWLVLQFVLCELTPVLLLEAHAEQPKRLSGCNATLLFELQREIVGKFLLISSQISTSLVSTGVLSSHVVNYFLASLLSISYPHWDSISNTSKNCTFSDFLWSLLFENCMKNFHILYEKYERALLCRIKYIHRKAFMLFFLFCFLHWAKSFRHFVEHCRWSHYIIKEKEQCWNSGL